MDAYQIELANPDFLKLASSYGIDAVRVTELVDLEYLLDKGFEGSFGC